MLLSRNAAHHVLKGPTGLREKRLKQRLNSRADISDSWEEMFGK